jgi:hypothetical protein
VVVKVPGPAPVAEPTGGQQHRTQVAPGPVEAARVPVARTSAESPPQVGVQPQVDAGSGAPAGGPAVGS